MDWKNLFMSFEGRVSRQPFWLGVLVLVVAQVVVFVLLGLVFGPSMTEGTEPNMIPLLIMALLFLYPSLALYAKRWHDRGKSGWWTLIILVPLIGSIWLLVECGFLRGTEGPNSYGNDPLA